MQSERRPLFILTDEQAKSVADQVFADFKANYIDANITSYDLYKLIKNNPSTHCGYELAKELENNSGARIDSMIVEDLDCIYLQVSKIREKAEETWVKDNNIEPKLKVGDIILYLSAQRKINSINLVSAKYHVQVEENNPNSNYIVDFEVIENI